MKTILFTILFAVLSTNAQAYINCQSYGNQTNCYDYRPQPVPQVWSDYDTLYVRPQAGY